ncbi:hypothetical protein SDC9_124979 [bioreactor metagenome]|uniref:Uncharacterized protein n=1 Tax=bioreactor metagenome TaxID=1076179 RepID=A0A645CM59_9ZZZZ
MFGARQHQGEVRAGAVHLGPGRRQPVEVLPPRGAAGGQHVRPGHAELRQPIVAQRLCPEEAVVDAVVDDVRVGDPEQVDRLLGAEPRHADHRVRPAGLLRSGRDRSGLVGEPPRHHVMQRDDISTGRRWQLEVHPVHHGAARVDRPAEHPAGSG